MLIMQAPNTLAGELTEKIMARLAGPLNPNPVFRNLDTPTYNRAYSEVLTLLNKYFKDAPSTVDQTDIRALLGGLSASG
jgi:hypothetical protein